MKPVIALAVLMTVLQDGVPAGPTPEAVQKARETLRETIKEETAKSGPAARQSLSHRLIAAAKSEPDPAIRAAHLVEAIDRAAEAADLHAATAALAELRKIPGLWGAARARVLDVREKKEKPGALAEAWFELAIESFDVEEYDVAVQACERAEAAGAKRGDATFLDPARDLREAARRAQRESEAVRAHV